MLERWYPTAHVPSVFAIDYEKLAENKAKVLQLQGQADSLREEALGEKVTDEDLATRLSTTATIPRPRWTRCSAISTAWG